MPNAILVLNAGSSSLKFSAFLDEPDLPKLLLRGQAEQLLTALRARRFLGQRGKPG